MELPVGEVLPVGTKVIDTVTDREGVIVERTAWTLPNHDRVRFTDERGGTLRLPRRNLELVDAG